jgi:hypothetical protein
VDDDRLHQIDMLTNLDALDYLRGLPVDFTEWPRDFADDYNLKLAQAEYRGALRVRYHANLKRMEAQIRHQMERWGLSEQDINEIYIVKCDHGDLSGDSMRMISREQAEALTGRAGQREVDE